MRKLTSLIGALLVSVGCSLGLQAANVPANGVVRSPEPQATVQADKSGISGLTLQMNPKFVGESGFAEVGNFYRKHTKGVSLNSVADLAGDWIQTYMTLVSPGADGGKGAEIEIVDGEPDKVRIVNFFDVGITVTATVDIAAGRISIPCQKLLQHSQFGWLDLAKTVVGADGTPEPDRSNAIEGVILSDGSISIESMWGIFVVEGEYANGVLGVFGNTLFERANASMTQKALNDQPFAYNVIVSQISPNVLSVKNFGNYGMTVEMVLNRDRSATVNPQLVRKDNLGDHFYTNAVTYNQQGQVTAFSGNILTKIASDLRNISWHDWTMTNSKSYLGIMTDGGITTSFDISFPELSVSEFEGEGTEESPYLIRKLDDLVLLAEKVNSVKEADFNATDAEGVKYASVFDGKYFRMESNINMAGYRFEPIGKDWYHHFSGTFDGNGHKIVGMNISTGEVGYAALFGRAGSKSVIKNLAVVDPVVDSQGSFAAAVAGWSDGVIDNCHVTGAKIINQGRTTGGLAGIAVTLTNSSVSESVVVGLGGNVAGLASEVDALVENSYAAEVSVVAASPAETYPSGGLVASLYGAVARNCYFSGSVDAACYQTGGYVGGIAGTCYRGTIERCFSVGQILTDKQNSAAGGLVGSLYGSVSDSYSIGVVSNVMSQKTGGLIGTIGSYEDNTGSLQQSSVAGCYTVSSVKAFVSGYQVEKEMRELIGTIQDEANPTLSAIYFNRQISNFGSQNYGVTTGDLTKAAGMDGLNVSVWTFTDGYYPRLKGLEENEAANIAASVLSMSDGNSVNKISQDVELRPLGQTQFLLQREGQWGTEGHFSSIADGRIVIGEEFGTDTLLVRNGLVEYSLCVKIAPIAYEGEGTELSPFLIKTKADILALQEMTNSKKQYFSDTYFKMTNDIDMEYDASFVGICFSPESSSANMFAGVFDGGGFAIRRLALDKVVWVTRPEDDESGKGGKPDNMQSTALGAFAGFFGRVGADGVVKNLTIAEDAKLSYWTSSGALVGDNYGKVLNCRNLAEVVGYSNNIGGIAGRNLKGGEISGCYNAGNVTSGYQNAGGISGYDQGLVENCANVGTICVKEISQGFTGTRMSTGAGGISGQSNGSVIRNVVNGGTVLTAGGKSGGIAGSFAKISHTSGTGANDMSYAISYGAVPVVKTADITTVGGLAGNPGTEGAVQSNYWDAQILLVKAIGNAEREGMSGVETSVLISGTPLEGFDTELWDFTAGKYPVLRQFADEDKMRRSRRVIVEMKPGVTAKDMSRNAVLSKEDGLKWSLKRQEAFAVARSSLFSPEEVDVLTVDTLVAVWDDYRKEIEIKRAPEVPLAGAGTEEDPFRIASAEDWNGLADYMISISETFEGKFLTVVEDIDFKDTEFKMLASDGVTLFQGSLDGGGKHIRGISFEPTAAYQGAICAVGEYGSVSNLTLAGDIETNKSYSGGFAGKVYGKLTSCVSEINVTQTSGSDVSGFGRIYASAILTDCVNKGNISGKGTNIAGVSAEVDNGAVFIRCGNEGTITNNGKGNYTAGLIAEANPIRLEDCYNKGNIVITDVDNTKNVAGLIAYATASSKSTGKMEMLRCWNEGDVTGTAVVAGLVAATTSSTTVNNPLILTECYNSGKIVAFATKTQGSTSSPTAGLVAFYNIGSQFFDCYNTGAISSTNQYTAGIAAYPKASIPKDGAVTFIGCYNEGDVVSTANHSSGIIAYIKDYVTLDDCYNVAKVGGAYGVGGIVGRLDGANSVVKNTWNSGEIVATLNRAGGIYGYGNGGLVENSFNIGDVATTCTEAGTAANTSGFGIGGVAGQGGAQFVNCYNMGTVSGPSQIGGLIGVPVRSKTQIVRCYNAGRIVAEADTCGALIGANLKNGKLWDEDNKVEESFFVTDYGTYTNNTVGSAVTIAELAKLENMGDGWTNGDDYTLPLITTIADAPQALIPALTVGFDGSDSESNVTQDFFVGAPEGVSWIASVENISFDGIHARFSPVACTGKVILTATAGELSRTFEINCNKGDSGVEELNSEKSVIEEMWFSTSGVRVPKPSAPDGQVYVVVRMYNDGTSEAEKYMNEE